MCDMALISGMDDDINLLVDNIKTNIESLIDASKAGDLEVNTENTWCMFMSLYQNADKKYNMKTANVHFQNMAKFQCLGVTVTNKNLINV